MFADFVRFVFRRNERAERRLLTGFLYIIFIAPFIQHWGFWCHLAQLHLVGNCATAYSAAFSGVVLVASTASAATFSIKPSSSASDRLSEFSKNSINWAGSLANRARI